MPEVPEGAKTPTDRKTKATPKPDTLTATAGGLDWEVPRDSLDDFELLDDLSRFEDGDASRMAPILRRLLGDQWDQAMETIRDKKTGRVTVSAGRDFVLDLMGSLNPNS